MQDKGKEDRRNQRGGGQEKEKRWGGVSKERTERREAREE